MGQSRWGRRVLFAGLATLAAGTAGAPAIAHAAPSTPFRWVEATITQVEAGFADRSLTCVQLVQGYLDRIAAYDRKGPTLRSIITVAASAIDEAKAMDASYAEHGPSGPLHCVPLVVKDNFDTANMPTTAGATAMKDNRPGDAFVVKRLRAAGALIIGKANLDEFAFGFQGSSSIGGQVRNPYDPQRGPGGSSSGTGAAVGGNLALAGLGTDTGGSIRVPSSVQGLVGIRPSLRLLSLDGIVPLAHFQDTAGPMCRTVRDCALLLGVMAGFDPGEHSGQYDKPLQRDDQGTLMETAAQFDAVAGGSLADKYARALDAQGMRGARVGVVRALFGSDADVVATMNKALDAMRGAGASFVDVTIPDLDTIASYQSVSQYEFRDHLTDYLQSWPSDEDHHKRTFEEVAASLGYQRSNVANFGLYGAAGATRHANPAYDKNTTERAAYVRPRLLKALEGLDALVYPTVQSPPAVGGPPATGPNNRLSPFSGLPALTMPAGFTLATPERVALPIGMELLGREFDEARLIKLASGYEASVAGTPLARTPPTFTPELASVAGAVLDAPAPTVAAPAAEQLPVTGPTSHVWPAIVGLVAALTVRGRRRLTKTMADLSG
jgi:amidase